MKNRWILGIAVLVVSSLSCGLFSLVGVNPVSINSVSVNPSTGSGTFTLHVLFRLKDEISDGEMVHCYYVTPDGGTTTIGDFIPEPYDFSHDIVFTATQPGLYSAGCQSVRSGSSSRTTFTVIENTPETQILSVTVSPPSGTGNFEMTVEYKVLLMKDQAPDEISFHYVTPSGLVTEFGTITPSVPESQFNTEVSLSGKLQFSVQQADGKVEPGSYTAACITEQNSNEVVTDFTVIEEVKPLTKPLTGGTITYDEASEVLSPHKNEFSYYPSQHHKWCSIIITIDSADDISGTCSSTGDKMPPGLYGDWNQSATIEGTISGKAFPGGQFIFTETLIESNYPGDPDWESTRKVVITGTGLFVSSTRATGTATFAIECRTVDENSWLCADDHSQFDSYTGSISWEFNGTSTGVP